MLDKNTELCMSLKWVFANLACSPLPSPCICHAWKAFSREWLQGCLPLWKGWAWRLGWTWYCYLVSANPTNMLSINPWSYMVSLMIGWLLYTNHFLVMILTISTIFHIVLIVPLFFTEKSTTLCTGNEMITNLTEKFLGFHTWINWIKKHVDLVLIE